MYWIPTKTGRGPGALTHGPYLQASMHSFYLGYSIHYIKLKKAKFDSESIEMENNKIQYLELIHIIYDLCKFTENFLLS